jgi:steroid delta-isomerase-like uncharacterized protein
MSLEPSATPAEVAARNFSAISAHDLEAIARVQHPEIVDDFVAIGRFRGVDAVRAFFTELFGAFPDFAIEIVHMVTDPEHAVVQWQATGTFTGTTFQGIHATGRAVDLRGCDVMHIVDGRIKANTIYYDGLGFARQVGMLPREGSPADKAMTAAFNAGIDVWARIRKPAGEPSR